MTDPLANLTEALDALRSVWRGTDAAPVAVSGLGRARLVAVNDALGAVRRHVDAVHAAVAAEIARESRPELGAKSLAKQQGFRSPVSFIAATTGGTDGDAAGLVKVGEATAPRVTLTGEPRPAKHPHVAAALAAGRIGTKPGSLIIAMLDRVALRADPAALDRAELTLVAAAPGLALDQLVKLITRAEAHLDPDGLEPREADRRAERALLMYERDGMLHLDGRFDIVSAAPIKTVIDAMVTASFRRDEPGRGLGGADLSRSGPAAGAVAGAVADGDAESRTLAQRRADALTELARHALGCDTTDLPLDDTTVVVRVSLHELRDGIGVAEIDGLTQPVSIGAARRMAASAGIIPCVLGTDSEILDWGRRKRLFTKAQRLALVERDGGCAMCGLEPGKTKAHHLAWWERDTGPTDLNNGVLLCESCHHRIHDNGWEIRIDDNTTRSKVWFIPPPHVDPDRTPRLGGRARYDYAA